MQIFKYLLIVCSLMTFFSCISSYKETSYKEMVESFDKYNTYRTINLDTVYKHNERYILEYKK